MVTTEKQGPTGAPTGAKPAPHEEPEGWQSKLETLTENLQAQRQEIETLRAEIAEAKAAGEPIKALQHELATALTTITSLQADLAELKKAKPMDDKKGPSRKSASKISPTDSPAPRSAAPGNAKKTGATEKVELDEPEEEPEEPPPMDAKKGAKPKVRQSLADAKGWL